MLAQSFYMPQLVFFTLFISWIGYKRAECLRVFQYEIFPFELAIAWVSQKEGKISREIFEISLTFISSRAAL